MGSRVRVSKDAPRVCAYGCVDELNSLLGLALAQGLSDRLAEALPRIQNELFHLGSDLPFPERDKEKVDIPQIEKRHVETLEKLIDTLNDVIVELLSGWALRAAEPSGVVGFSRDLTADALQPAIADAIAYWSHLEHAHLLHEVSVEIRDLPGTFLGFASPTLIWTTAEIYMPAPKNRMLPREL